MLRFLSNLSPFRSSRELILFYSLKVRPAGMHQYILKTVWSVKYLPRIGRYGFQRQQKGAFFMAFILYSGIDWEKCTGDTSGHDRLAFSLTHKDGFP